MIRLFRTPLCSLKGILKLSEHSAMLSDLQLISVSSVQLILTDCCKTDTPFTQCLILRKIHKKKTHQLQQGHYNSSGWFQKWFSMWYTLKVKKWSKKQYLSHVTLLWNIFLPISSYSSNFGLNFTSQRALPDILNGFQLHSLVFKPV